MEPLVYIILVNYKGYKDTVACVESLLKIDYKNYKIVVVENASTDSEKIKNDEFLNRETVVLYATENNGFSDGNNIGINYAMTFDPDYILLLNNDTVVTPTFLNGLVQCALRDESIGIVTGRIYFFSQPQKLWYSGGEYNRSTGKTLQCLYDESVTDNQEISFASGCLMLISRECINKVGLLDDSYFMYSEDTDYCCKTINAGMKIVWTPDSIIYHKVSASTGDNSVFQRYYLTRNNLIMIKKYSHSKTRAYLCMAVQCLKDMIKRRMKIKAAVWAYYDFFRGISGISDRFK